MGRLRICSGVLRGRWVETPAGEGTRPLLTRVRKSLVDILRPRLKGAAVLDLFAGSGAIGFELISNGAVRCVLNELEPGTAAMIRNSAEKLGVEVEVHNLDALDFLERYGERCGLFDVIVVAPPYGLQLQQRVVERLDTKSLLGPRGLIVVQREAHESECRVDPKRLRRIRTSKYGRTVFEFYEPELPHKLEAGLTHSG